MTVPSFVTSREPDVSRSGKSRRGPVVPRVPRDSVGQRVLSGIVQTRAWGGLCAGDRGRGGAENHPDDHGTTDEGGCARAPWGPTERPRHRAAAKRGASTGSASARWRRHAAPHRPRSKNAIPENVQKLNASNVTAEIIATRAAANRACGEVPQAWISAPAPRVASGQGGNQEERQERDHSDDAGSDQRQQVLVVEDAVRRRGEGAGATPDDRRFVDQRCHDRVVVGATRDAVVTASRGEVPTQGPEQAGNHHEDGDGQGCDRDEHPDPAPRRPRDEEHGEADRHSHESRAGDRDGNADCDQHDDDLPAPALPHPGQELQRKWQHHGDRRRGTIGAPSSFPTRGTTARHRRDDARDGESREAGDLGHEVENEELHDRDRRRTTTVAASTMNRHSLKSCSTEPSPSAASKAMPVQARKCTSAASAVALSAAGAIRASMAR